MYPSCRFLDTKQGAQGTASGLVPAGVIIADFEVPTFATPPDNDADLGKGALRLVPQGICLLAQGDGTHDPLQVNYGLPHWVMVIRITAPFNESVIVVHGRELESRRSNVPKAKPTTVGRGLSAG